MLIMNKLIEKIKTGQDLTLEDGIKLYDLDIFTLGDLATEIRQKLYGKKFF